MSNKRKRFVIKHNKPILEIPEQEEKATFQIKKPRFNKNAKKTFDIRQVLNNDKYEYGFFKINLNSNDNQEKFKILSTSFQLVDTKPPTATNGLEDRIEFYLAITGWNSEQDLEHPYRWFLVKYLANGDNETYLKYEIIPETNQFNYQDYKSFCKALNNKKICFVDGSFWEPNNSVNDGDSNPKLSINIYFFNKVILQEYHSLISNTCFNETILSVMSFVYGYIYFKGVGNCTEFLDNAQIEDLYDSIYKNQRNTASFLDYESEKITVSDLIPTLWKHQESAVKWMLHRELGHYKNPGSLFFTKHLFEDIHLYYHKALGFFLTEQIYQEYLEKIDQISSKMSLGGILADEMGLGKTIDLIALILNNRKSIQTQIKYSFFTEEKMLSQKDPLQQSQVQCYCGIDTGFIPSVTIEQDKMFQMYKQQNYFLIENLIKCFLCGNYQHLECSGYQLENNYFPYLCCRCWLQIEPIDSASTLVVCPRSILQQWINEFRKHVKSDLKIFHYNGIKSSEEYCFPPDLVQNDIVLTTYDVLKTEIDYITSHDFNNTLRNSKKYHTRNSPLCSINWWRLCFDEAQLVEEKFSRVFKMANCLHSKYRWAVTGTPIQKNISDLFGLIYFIREYPYCKELIWRNALYKPFCLKNQQPLIKAMSQCFWRTSKRCEMMNEIKLPKPIFCTKKFLFSQIEQDFYLQEASKIRLSISERFRNFPSFLKINKLSQSAQQLIFSSTLKLRQICCGFKFLPNCSKENEFNSLDDVLDRMIENAKIDCEKAHREKIAAMNGLAAINLGKGDLNTAINIYKEALDSIEQSVNSELEVRTDKTQQYHIYYNLAEIFDSVGCKQVDFDDQPFPHFNGSQPISESIIKAINVSDLNIDQEKDKLHRLKAKQIYDSYLNVARLACVTGDKYRLELIKTCQNTKQNFKLECSGSPLWFICAINKVSNISGTYELRYSLHNVLCKLQSHPTEILSWDHLKIKLLRYIETFENVRQLIQQKFGILNSLMDSKSDEMIRQHCMNFSFRKCPSSCNLCDAERIIDQFEEIIFKVDKKFIDVGDPSSTSSSMPAEKREANWNENNHIVALRKLGQWFKLKTSDLDVIKEIDTFFNYIEDCKKEYKAHRKYFIDCSEFFHRIDELNQAQKRYPSYDTVELNELQQRDENFKVAAEDKFKTTCSRLVYLKNLKNKVFTDHWMCSICYGSVDKFALLTCGHIICVSCLDYMRITDCSRRCPVCRFNFQCSKLFFVGVANEPLNELQIKSEIKGSWATKIVKIIVSIKQIFQSSNNNNEKILIFSSWIPMLELMHKALTVNDLPSILISSNDRNFSTKIDEFRLLPTCNILLLPIKFGSKGLNLTEASHLIFINPILNKRDELQAIGRIHRIGQSKQIYVHKFIVLHTIEELIENNSQDVSRRICNKSNQNEFADLTIEDFFKLLQIYSNNLVVAPNMQSPTSDTLQSP